MGRKKTSEKGREIRALAKKAEGPVLTEEDYRLSLLKYTNFHNENTPLKTLRKWALEYIQKTDKSRKKADVLGAINRATDFELRSLGMLAHASMRGDYVAPEHIKRMKDIINGLVGKYTETVVPRKVSKPAVPEQTAEEKLAEQVAFHASQVDAALDDFLVKDTPFSMREYLVTNNVKGPIAKKIAKCFDRLCAELSEAAAGKNAQLKEGYSNLGKVRLKRLLAMVMQVQVDCNQHLVSSKAPRKPRARKEKPASVLVSRLKFLKEFPELKLTSQPAVSIIGSSEVWLYDTERRRLTVYKAADGQKLSVKGTTVINYDVTTSESRMLRKPEVFLAGSLARKAVNTAFAKLSTKPSTPTGRTNENMIILKVF